MQKRKKQRECVIVSDDSLRFQSCDTTVIYSSNEDLGNVLKGNDIFIHNFGVNNTFVGKNAGNFTATGENNSGFGENALRRYNIGSSNTAIGTDAVSGFVGLINELSENTAIGYKALSGDIETKKSNEYRGGGGGCDGVRLNTVIGVFTLPRLVGCVGAHAGENDLIGLENTFIGCFSGQENQEGEANVAVGFQSLQNNIHGDSNIAIGTLALVHMTDGTNNIAIGNAAGGCLIQGDNNVYIGNFGPCVTGGQENATIRLGDSLFHQATHIAGIFGNSVDSAGIPVFIDNTGKLGSVVSSRRFKKNISLLGEGEEEQKALLSKILLLAPSTFVYNDDPEEKRQIGLIAEEVTGLFPE